MPAMLLRTPIIPLGIVWLLLCLTLSAHWEANPHYAYGWLVPPLAIYLFARRWQTRRAPGPGLWRFVRWPFFILTLSLFPIWLFAQPAPDWRLLNWVFAGQAIALSLLTWATLGGARWGGYFVFPTVFILTAIPWPAAVEGAVIQTLTDAVTASTVAFLGLIDVPAVQHGNIIEIGHGLLGVDEACSGVRSLQAALMIALFLGELERLDAGRRLALLGLGAVFAFLTNVARASLLGYIAQTRGTAAIGQWHDPAGFSVLTVCLLAIWASARWLARSGDLEDLPPAASAPAHPFPALAACCMAGWLVVMIGGVELRFRGGPAPTPARWEFSLPAERLARSGELLDPGTIEMLRFEEGHAAAWKSADGGEWLAFHFRWPSGRGSSRLLAKLHAPEILPARGRMGATGRARSAGIHGGFHTDHFPHDAFPAGRKYRACVVRPLGGRCCLCGRAGHAPAGNPSLRDSARTRARPTGDRNRTREPGFWRNRRRKISAGDRSVFQ